MPRKTDDGRNDGYKDVNESILQMLQTQNGLLKSINDGLKTLQSQSTLLGNIETRLERIESQDQGKIKQRRNIPWNSQHVLGSWMFVESPNAIEKRNSVKDDPYRNSESFGHIGDERELLGEVYPWGKSPSRSVEDVYSSTETYTPCWSGENHYDRNARDFLPALAFNSSPELVLNNCIYSLTIKYNCSVSTSSGPPDGNEINPEAGIVVGEMEFNNKGFVMAKQADWDKLLSGEKQTQQPKSSWLRRKISEPWANGDEIKIEIDTNDNTIVFQKGKTPEKVFWNVLTFTNNWKYPEYFRVFAYCGWVHPASYGGLERQNEPVNIKLTIIP